jgi:hypothetical protein
MGSLFSGTSNTKISGTSSQEKQTLAAPKTGVWQGGGKEGDKGILSFWLVKKPLRITDFWPETDDLQQKSRISRVILPLRMLSLGPLLLTSH